MEIALFQDATVVVPDAAVDAVVSGALALGIANCFFGRRIFRLTMGIVGLVGGGVAAAVGVYAALGNRPAALIAAAALAGLVAAVVLVLFYRVALFVVGAAAGFGLAVAFCKLTGTEPNLGIFIFGAVIGGLGALALERGVVIVLSALTGSAVVGASVLHYLESGPDIQALHATGGNAAKLRELVTAPVYVALGGAVLLAIISLIVQFKLTAKRRPAEAEEGEAASGD